MNKKTNKIHIPADVPLTVQATYLNNYKMLTKDTGHIFIFSGDQKIEHLNEDFFGENIHPDAQDPEHLFRIASQGTIGAFATQLGLIAHYGKQYPQIPYIVKMNSKTNIVPTSEKDPYSMQLYSIDDIVRFSRESGLSIIGIGYTVYLGSEHEHEMLHEAASLILEAHHNGLLAIVWMYPRGQAVTKERDPQLIAGAAGVATCLGADAAKVNTPLSEPNAYARDLQMIVLAAGRTKIVCSGGAKQEPTKFLAELATQLSHGIAGCAVGRNIYQSSLADSIKLTNAMSELIYDGTDLPTVLATYYPK